MPTALQAVLQGIVQGLTEFLPVSSSAHLILARAFFGFDGDKFGLAFDVSLHAGTLIAVLMYFRRELGAMLAALPRLFQVQTDDDARLIWLLVVGTIPTGIVGALFSHQIEERWRTPQVAAVTLTLGAIGLIAAERLGRQTRTERSLSFPEAFGIGCAQALALVPGVSRSGATLTLALFLGLRRGEAARFIFLLSIPAILGAAAMEGPKALAAGVGSDERTLLVLGVASSAVVSYIVVRWFIRYLGNHSLVVFAWYRFALALAVAVWLLQ